MDKPIDQTQFKRAAISLIKKNFTNEINLDNIEWWFDPLIYVATLKYSETIFSDSPSSIWLGENLYLDITHTFTVYYREGKLDTYTSTLFPAYD